MVHELLSGGTETPLILSLLLIAYAIRRYLPPHIGKAQIINFTLERSSF